MTLISHSWDDAEGEAVALTEAGFALGEWSARDFSNFYVRFRPHLLNHAARFLTNKAQAEEVVQDAFLYLMTSLPELESELDVLRFLKWKTKMLAIDVLRKEGRMAHAPLDMLDEEQAEPNQASDRLEAAEDASIVRLALAKLQPRHREILIQNVYLEKSIDEIAQELQISQNASRQLLFRARRAFKAALVGEAETAGLTVSQILSLAYSRAGTFTLIVGLMAGLSFTGLGILSQLGESTGQLAIEQVEQSGERMPPSSTRSSSRPSPSELQPSFGSADPDRQGTEVSVGEVSVENLPAVSDEAETSFAQPSAERAVTLVATESEAMYSESIIEFTRGFLQTVDSSRAEASQNGEVITLNVENFELTMLLSTNDSGDYAVDYFLVSGVVSGQELLAVSRTTHLSASLHPDGSTSLQFIASDFIVTNVSDQAPAISETYFREVGIEILLDISRSGEVLSAESRSLLRFTS